MTSSNNTYRCEECDTTFDNENDFMEHKNYAKFRRGPAGNSGYDKRFHSILIKSLMPLVNNKSKRYIFFCTVLRSTRDNYIIINILQKI